MSDTAESTATITEHEAEQVARANAIDSGWRVVADTALAFVQRFSQP